jgi:hypothetical protein
MVWLYNSEDENTEAWLVANHAAREVHGFNHWLQSQPDYIRHAANRADAERGYFQQFEELRRDADGVLPTISIDTQPGEAIHERIMAWLNAHDRFGLNFVSNANKIDFEAKWLTTVKTGSCAVVNLRKCRITKLILGQGSIPDASIVGCKIGELRLAGQLQKLTLRHSDIRKLTITQHEPLAGPVSIRRVSFPKEDASVHSLRRLRAELVRSHNLDSAGPVHAAEQRLNRRYLDRTDAVFNVLYDLTSAYGSSTLKPLDWFLGLASANFALLVCTDGTALTVDRSPSGWQHSLFGATPTASAARATYLTVNQIFSPLGIFGTNPLVVAANPWIALASIFICFLATVCLGLFVLALRRRFRLDGR